MNIMGLSGLGTSRPPFSYFNGYNSGLQTNDAPPFGGQLPDLFSSSGESDEAGDEGSDHSGPPAAIINAVHSMMSGDHGNSSTTHGAEGPPPQIAKLISEGKIPEQVVQAISSGRMQPPGQF